MGYTYRECRTLSSDIKPNKACRYRAKNLGTSFSSPMECIAAAKAHRRCKGNEIMWSDSYNKYWGCRCCSAHPTCPAGSSRYRDNNNWDVYNMRSVLQVKHLSCVYLGCVYLSIKLLNNQFLSFHNHVVSLFSVDFIFI